MMMATAGAPFSLAPQGQAPPPAPPAPPASAALPPPTAPHVPQKRPRLNFTLQQRQQIWQRSQANPKMKQQELARWAKDEFRMDAEPSQSAISYAIRRHKQYEKLGEAEGRMKRPRNVKHPKLDTALAKWVSECYQNGTRISSLMVKQKAVTFCERLHIPKSSRPNFSNGWLHAFNKRYGFRNYARHREVISDDASVAAADDSIPRRARGPYSIAFKRDVVRYYNFSDRDMQATLQEFFSGDKTAAALEKKRKFVIAWAREEERIEELMAYDNETGMAPPRPSPPPQTSAPAPAPRQKQTQRAPSQARQQQQAPPPQLQQRPAPPVVSNMLTPTAEQVIVSWVIDMRQTGAPVSSAMLEQKAHEVAAEFGIPFVPSWNWRQEFLKRYSYPLGGYVPQGNPYEDHQRMHGVSEEHSQQHEQQQGYAMGNGSWRGDGTGAYGAPPGSHQALLLNMRGPQSSATARYNMFHEPRVETDPQYYPGGPQVPPQYQQQAYQHHQHHQHHQPHQHHEHYQPHHQHYAAHMTPQPVQQAAHLPVVSVLSHMQAQQAVSAAHPSAPVPVPMSAQIQSQAQVQAPAQEPSAPATTLATTLTPTAPSTAATSEQTPSKQKAEAAQTRQAIRNLGDKVVEARQVETKLRVEGLRYDNEIKRMKILEENILARKRLKDAGIAQDEIDKLLPPVQLK